mmetsp:Transcript_99498/g.148996  ORF Transcript_99498/g.148996 Transcript_99498/m.148996 type:complete len:262 (-) Transcript_99498:1303-2088(-)
MVLVPRRPVVLTLRFLAPGLPLVCGRRLLLSSLLFFLFDVVRLLIIGPDLTRNPEIIQRLFSSVANLFVLGAQEGADCLRVLPPVSSSIRKRADKRASPHSCALAVRRKCRQFVLHPVKMSHDHFAGRMLAEKRSQEHGSTCVHTIPGLRRQVCNAVHHEERCSIFVNSMQQRHHSLSSESGRSDFRVKNVKQLAVGRLRTNVSNGTQHLLHGEQAQFALSVQLEAVMEDLLDVVFVDQSSEFANRETFLPRIGKQVFGLL